MAAIIKSAGGVTWKYIDTEIDSNNFYDVFKTQLVPVCCPPHWKDKKFKIKVFEDGLSNKLVGLYPNDEPSNNMVLLRFNGLNTDEMIDRDKEIVSMLTLGKAGLSVPVYCQFKNGLCYGFAPGRTIKVTEMSDFNISECVIRTVARLHHAKVDESYFGTKPKLDEFLVDWIDKIPTVFDTEEKNKKFQEIYGGSSETIKKEIAAVRRELEKFKSPLVFCHNDLLSGNIIFDGTQKSIQLIDFEYCGLNPRAFDIGDHFCEFSGIDLDDLDYSRYPNEEFQKKWIHRYLQEVASLNGESQDIDQATIHEFYREVNKYALAAHLTWAMWALLQAASSNIDFDYMKYSEIRFKEYLAKKDKFLSL